MPGKRQAPSRDLPSLLSVLLAFNTCHGLPPQGSRVVLQHVVVYGAGQDGVACTHGAHVVAERVQVHDCVMAGLLATGHGTRADVNAGSLTSCRWGLR